MFNSSVENVVDPGILSLTMFFFCEKDAENNAQVLVASEPQTSLDIGRSKTVLVFDSPTIWSGTRKGLGPSQNPNKFLNILQFGNFHWTSKGFDRSWCPEARSSKNPSDLPCRAALMRVVVCAR